MSNSRRWRLFMQWLRDQPRDEFVQIGDLKDLVDVWKGENKEPTDDKR